MPWQHRVVRAHPDPRRSAGWRAAMTSGCRTIHVGPTRCAVPAPGAPRRAHPGVGGLTSSPRFFIGDVKSIRRRANGCVCTGAPSHASMPASRRRQRRESRRVLATYCSLDSSITGHASARDARLGPCSKTTSWPCSRGAATTPGVDTAGTASSSASTHGPGPDRLAPRAARPPRHRIRAGSTRGECDSRAAARRYVGAHARASRDPAPGEILGPRREDPRRVDHPVRGQGDTTLKVSLIRGALRRHLRHAGSTQVRSPGRANGAGIFGWSGHRRNPRLCPKLCPSRGRQWRVCRVQSVGRTACNESRSRGP